MRIFWHWCLSTPFIETEGWLNPRHRCPIVRWERFPLQARLKTPHLGLKNPSCTQKGPIDSITYGRKASRNVWDSSVKVSWIFHKPTRDNAQCKQSCPTVMTSLHSLLKMLSMLCVCMPGKVFMSLSSFCNKLASFYLRQCRQVLELRELSRGQVKLVKVHIPPLLTMPYISPLTGFCPLLESSAGYVTKGSHIFKFCPGKKTGLFPWFSVVHMSQKWGLIAVSLKLVGVVQFSAWVFGPILLSKGKCSFLSMPLIRHQTGTSCDLAICPYLSNALLATWWSLCVCYNVGGHVICIVERKSWCSTIL